RKRKKENKTEFNQEGDTQASLQYGPMDISEDRDATRRDKLLLGITTKTIFLAIRELSDYSGIGSVNEARRELNTFARKVDQYGKETIDLSELTKCSDSIKSKEKNNPALKYAINIIIKQNNKIASRKKSNAKSNAIKSEGLAIDRRNKDRQERRDKGNEDVSTDETLTKQQNSRVASVRRTNATTNTITKEGLAIDRRNKDRQERRDKGDEDVSPDETLTKQQERYVALSRKANAIRKE